MALNPSAFFFFNSEKQGWSERWWASNSSTALAAVAVAGGTLLAARSKMLAVGVTIPWAYASFDDTFRDVVPIPIPEPTPAGVWNNFYTTTAMQPQGDLVARLFSGTRGGKFTYISGAPSEAFKYPPQYNPPFGVPAFKAAWDAWVNVLVNGDWAWKGVNYDPTASPIIDVVSLVAAGTNWTATLSSTATLKAGDKIKLFNAVFSGAQPPRGNRIYGVAQVTSATVATLDWLGADLSGLTYIGLGKAQKLVHTLFPITRVTYDKQGTHKRGVGFGRPVGRRRNK